MKFWPLFRPRLLPPADPVLARRIIILGLPKSGTTALFYGIRNVLTEPCTERFEPLTSKSLTAPTEFPNYLTKVLPTSWQEAFPVRLLDAFTHRIFLVRDPRDVLVSRMLYHIWNTTAYRTEATVQAWLELLEAKRQAPQAHSCCELMAMMASWRGQSLEQELDRCTPATELLYRLQQTAPTHCVFRYEHMVTGQMETLESYLEMNLTKPFQVAPEVARVERTRSAGSWKHWFTAQDVATFQPLLTTYMEAYGYQDDWSLAANPSISAQHSTDYVLELVNQQRAQAKLPALAGCQSLESPSP